MSDEVRSRHPQRKRILIINNPDVVDDGENHSHSPHNGNQATPNAPIPTPPFPDRQLPSKAHFPSPLTTNLPPTSLGQYPSSRSNPSNPALSSPSSTSSRAFESTPPPSTPGQSNPPDDLSSEGTLGQEAVIVSYPESSDITPPSASSRSGFFNMNRLLIRPGHTRRLSSNSNIRPNTSPTASSIPEYMPSTSSSSLNEPPAEDRITLLVTRDAEHFSIVDVSGAKSRDAAFIRERIYTKLQIEDDEQPRYSIYRTEISQYAIGDALSDEQLLQLCIDRGDVSGSIKLLVSHSQAPVHVEPMHDSNQASPTVNTIPPPVLPNMYAPLRPRRTSRSRRDSVSSTSERQPPDPSAGYEASVSDDLDGGERESRRPTIRPPLQQPQAPRSQPLPTRQRSPSGYGRSHSPGGLMSPDRGQPPYHSPVLRSERPRGSGLPTPPSQLNSPELSRFHDSPQAVGPSWGVHIRTGSDAAIERERTVQTSEDYSYRRHRDLEEREREGDRTRSPNCPTPKEKAALRRGNNNVRREPRYEPGWSIVPHNVHTSENGYPRPRPTVQDSYPSPSRQQGVSSPYSQLQIPRHPDIPAPHPPMDPRRGEKQPRPAGRPVPPAFFNRSKYAAGGSGTGPLMPQSPPGRNSHLNGAKSMNDLRSQFNAQGSASKRPPAPPSLSSKPSNERSVSGSGNHDHGTPMYPDGTSLSELGIAKSYEGSRGPLSSPTMSYLSSSRSTTQQHHHTASQHSSSTFLVPSSSSQEPYPRPHSSLASDPTSSSHRPGRHTQSPNSDNVSPETPYRPMASVPLHHPGASSYRDDSSHHVPTFGPRPQPHARHERSNTDGYGLSATSTMLRLPRTPPRSPITGMTPPLETRDTSSATVLPVQRTLSSLPVHEDETPSSTESTIRGDEASRFLGMLDHSAAGSATLIASKQGTNYSARPPSPNVYESSSTSNIDTLSSTLISSMNSGDSDSEEMGTIWAKPPPLRANPSRPVLPPIDTDSSPSSRPLSLPRDGSKLPNLPNYIPEPPRTTNGRRPLNPGAGKKLQDQRTSRFDNNFEMTWAPRPPPEEVFERLQEYFPEHDIDEPVIEAPSGGTSPTSAEPNVPIPTEKQKFRHKKSIRVVAAEHKRRVDRTSRMEPTASHSVALRKRNTKLWGSKLEEVPTHDQAIQAQQQSLSETTPGTAKPIFRWVRGELIGKGTYGKVYLALNATTGEMIAVKQVEIPRTASDKDDSRQVSVVEALKLESETLKDLDHPHIVQYLGFEETPTFLSIFLEYVPGGSIASCLRKHGKFDEEVTKSFTGQILSGLEYLHSKGILHRDMKADNILVETTGICKISDFGISKRTDDINMAGAYTSMQGTVFWMAPEVIDANKRGYNSKIDIWSVGCVVFEMWTGQRPWSGREAMAVLLQLYQTKQGPPVPQEVILSPLADDFRQKCFAMNPDERPTAAELRLHPYLELQPDWSFNGFK